MMRTALVCLTALCMPAAALADEWEEQVAAKISTLGMDMAAQGWDLDRKAYMSRLGEDETGYHTVVLSDYSKYNIVAVGDRDCSDLDIYVYDQDDNLVVHNVAPADIVNVELDPGASGEYRLAVHMDDCLSEPCRYGVAVFSD